MPATNVRRTRPTAAAAPDARASAAASAPDSVRATPAGLAGESDERLLAGVVDGSQAHFRELYERYFRRIYSFCYGRVRNHADAEEITQETFTAVFRSARAFGGRSSLLSWIYGIARNTANNHLRRARQHDERSRDLEPGTLAAEPSLGSCGPEEQLELSRYADALKRRLEGVAGWQVEVFCMRHLEDLSIAEICERTQRSSDAVRSSLYRVKRHFFEAAGAGGRS